MIHGSLTPEGLAVVTLSLGPLTAHALIDTGFDGHLQLPDTVVGAIPLTRVGSERYGFPDGSEATFDVYEVRVRMGGVDCVAQTILSPTGEALVGVKFLADYRLTIDYPASTVTLERTRT